MIPQAANVCRIFSEFLYCIPQLEISKTLSCITPITKLFMPSLITNPSGRIYRISGFHAVFVRYCRQCATVTGSTTTILS